MTLPLLYRYPSYVGNCYTVPTLVSVFPHSSIRAVFHHLALCHACPKMRFRLGWRGGGKATAMSSPQTNFPNAQVASNNAPSDQSTMAHGDEAVDGLANTTLPIPPSPPPSPSSRPRRRRQLQIPLRPRSAHVDSNGLATPSALLDPVPFSHDPMAFPSDPSSSDLPHAPILYEVGDARMPRPASYPPFPSALDAPTEDVLIDSNQPPSLPAHALRVRHSPDEPRRSPSSTTQTSRPPTPNIPEASPDAQVDVSNLLPSVCRAPSPVYEPAASLPTPRSSTRYTDLPENFSSQSRVQSQSFTYPRGGPDIRPDLDDGDYSLPVYPNPQLDQQSPVDHPSKHTVPMVTSSSVAQSSQHQRAVPKRAKTSIPQSLSSSRRRREHFSSAAPEPNSAGNILGTGTFHNGTAVNGRASSTIAGSTIAFATTGTNTLLQIEPSPYSTRQTMERSDSATSVESKLYNAYTDALHDEARSRSGGLRTIVNLLRDADGNPIVIEKAALAIAVLSENDPATRDVFGQYSAVQMLIQCLSMRIPSKYDRATTIEMILYAIASLLKDSPRNVRLFEMFQGAHKMGKAAASERYENNAAIPNHALNALSELKHHAVYVPESEGAQLLGTSSSPGRRASSGSTRTIRYVLRSMALHEHRVSVQENGLDALRTLVGRADRNALTGHILRSCVQATSTAFKMHKESREVQWQCLTLICDLEDVRDGMFSVPLDVVCLFGAMRMVILEAKDCGRRKARVAKALMRVVKRAIDVSVRNSWRSVEFKDAAVEAGAVETMLEALSLFESETDTVDKICTMLRVMLQSDEGRYRLHTVQSACAILGAIESANSSAIGSQPG